MGCAASSPNRGQVTLQAAGVQESTTPSTMEENIRAQGEGQQDPAGASMATNGNKPEQTGRSSQQVPVCPFADIHNMLEEAAAGQEQEETGPRRGDSAPARPGRNRRSRRSAGNSIDAFVNAMYEKILADERLAVFFDGVDIAKLKGQQNKVMLVAIAGEQVLGSEAMQSAPTDMRAIHLRLIREKGLREHHFDWFMEHVEEALKDFADVGEESKQRALTNLKSVRSHFRPPEPGE
mmetsp:Transcript_32597/g.71982  ORF Transcript_32597/g.71982 Transcript_32597/m.71982 type:complete len:236 (+) Transcript_32597:151-858(+)|eukprot:CAMPEP_0202892992 /NCGR_PEP_ID=MMETSP1392-20130828/2650_1 /ASSEMBLY_ACC=CAM_ASM_000868 /TAXON_ID=225041 /ORGANISM="Chlamydomonas chlamydogama, Strain SAG 11-48b" /LENGTH=235 /DNA_ID=CAMNT_0049577159 /DNA_START=127 /DNA_END=834 /DNA_ORIENTATION=-